MGRVVLVQFESFSWNPDDPDDRCILGLDTEGRLWLADLTWNSEGGYETTWKELDMVGWEDE